ncbi:WG repeat-containing protein [Sphingobacterium sp. DN00404]|uniref:WG repeat-containing protein n=1 Tax=Sphingobacterium micropteri TaxID=2763501 RepID=A0ABR7YRJ4_9SPHI|nr:WG repeat-containing protein [Sphingobacterium micropteri]MBD1433917.1 WG repeat-containing protein [Sphingobacterium micropteri]
MTKEQAYEKLELPVGTDLQVVRQKFNQMHNEFLMQIDGVSFNPAMKQKKEQQLEELKEAYTLLNESEGMDDSASLPRTERTFDHGEPSTHGQTTEELSLEDAFALFRLTEQQDTTKVQQAIQSRLEKLNQQYDTIDIAVAKEAIRVEIEKAGKAKVIIDNWQENLAKKQEQQKEQASPSKAESRQALTKRKYWMVILAVMILVSLGYGIWRSTHKSSIDLEEQQKIALTWIPTHRVSEEGKDGVYVRNRELTKEEQGRINTDAKLNAETYVNMLHENDSLMVLQETELSYVIQLKDKEELVYLPKDSKSYIFKIGQSTEAEQTKEIDQENPTEAQQTDVDWRKRYHAIEDFHEGRAVVFYNQKYGYVDLDGNVVIPLKYWTADPFKDGLARVGINHKYGFLDKNGRTVIPLKYDMVQEFREGLTLVKLNEKVGFLDEIGKEVVPLRYDDANSFFGGIALVKLNKKYGYVDKTGKEITAINYDYGGINSNLEGVIVVKKDKKYGYIGITGNEVIPLKYDFANPFEEGLASVKLNGKHGFIDKTGQEVIPLKYEYTSSFSHGLAAVKLNNKWGYVDKFGRVVIDFKYDKAYDAANIAKHGGISMHVVVNDKTFYINSQGKCIEWCENAPEGHP